MNKNIVQFCMLGLILGVTFTLYVLGITGSFYYDDFRPLGGLLTVKDFDSAWVYVFSEISGPLGRPISMLSFLLNINDWPNKSENILFINIILHISNGLLVFGISYYITTLYRQAHKKNYYIALIATSFWLLLPIHVSTSLIAIQRMAGLSAFFLFSGLLAYLYGLHKQSSVDDKEGGKITKLVTLQLIIPSIFTLLAMFSKENGVLLPAFIFVLEITLLAKINTISRWRIARISVSGLGLMLIIIYLAYLTLMKGIEFPGREFTLIERLLTQPQILIEYLQLAFFPSINAFTPFHDNYKAVTNLFDSYQALLSMFAVCTSFIVAVFTRNKWPLYSFAVLWFFTAHLLESSVIALELYYEHRNYVALLGPCLALVMALFKISNRYKNISVGLTIIYTIMLLVTLYLTTRLWGDQLLAAETWFIEKPGSTRASEHLAYLYMKEGKLEQAERVFSIQTTNCPSCITSHAQAMLTSCVLGHNKQTLLHYQSIMSLIATTSNSTGLATTLGRAHQAIKNNKCTALSFTQLSTLNHALLTLPASPFNKKLGTLQNLYVLAVQQKNKEEAIKLLYRAWKVKADMNIATELVKLLLSENKNEQAIDFLNNYACSTSDFLLQNLKKKQCNALLQLITDKGVARY